MNRTKSFIASVILLLIVNFVVADDHKPLKVYINSETIDFDFLRENINYVDYVYDPQSCDVQIILLKQTSGNGGYKYAVQFIGKNFSDINDFILSTTILPNDSEDIERQKLVRTIKSGLTPFINEKDPFNNLVIEVKSKCEIEQDVSNKWNNWVFNVTGSGSFHKEERYNDYSYIGRITASQIKEKFKIENVLYSYNAVRDYDQSYHVQVNANQYYTKMAFSLTEHWSAGFVAMLMQDTRRNIQSQAYVKPAIEYNFFPWSVSNKISLTASYTVGPLRNSYYRETKYHKTTEFLWDQTAYIKLLTKQSWGEATTLITLQNYINQPDKYDLSFDAEALFYIAKGLSLNISITAEDVNNQLYIPLNGYTDAEKYIGSAVQETGYYLIGSIGITFRFGSLTNNIVNRRL